MCSCARAGTNMTAELIASVDPNELRQVAASIRDRGIEAVAITSVFSPISDSHERAAAEIISSELPDAAISLSSEIGRLGLIERENATIVNACLSGLAIRIVRSLEEAVARLAIAAPVYFSQNDGTLMSAAYTQCVTRWPPSLRVPPIRCEERPT